MIPTLAHRQPPREHSARKKQHDPSNPSGRREVRSLDKESGVDQARSQSGTRRPYLNPANPNGFSRRPLARGTMTPLDVPRALWAGSRCGDR